MKMSKEYIQALDNLFGLVAFQGSLGKAQKYFDVIEPALQRLEAIDNAKPSEALECLADIARATAVLYQRAEGKDECDYLEKMKEIGTSTEFQIIKQALLKAQEQENVIRILFEKNVRIYWIKSYNCVKSYNNGLPKKEQLTQEEFELLKRWTKDDKIN